MSENRKRKFTENKELLEVGDELDIGVPGPPSDLERFLPSGEEKGKQWCYLCATGPDAKNENPHHRRIKDLMSLIEYLDTNEVADSIYEYYEDNVRDDLRTYYKDKYPKRKCPAFEWSVSEIYAHITGHEIKRKNIIVSNIKTTEIVKRKALGFLMDKDPETDKETGMSMKYVKTVLDSIKLQQSLLNDLASLVNSR